MILCHPRNFRVIHDHEKAAPQVEMLRVCQQFDTISKHHAKNEVASSKITTWRVFTSLTYSLEGHTDWLTETLTLVLYTPHINMRNKFIENLSYTYGSSSGTKFMDNIVTTKVRSPNLYVMYDLWFLDPFPLYLSSNKHLCMTEKYILICVVKTRNRNLETLRPHCQIC